MNAPGIRAAWLAAAASIWLATLANLPLWRELEAVGLLRTPGGWLLAGALATVIAAALFALLSLLAWRWTLKPAICILLAVAGAGGYFMWTYHVLVNADMVVNVLQTDAAEAAGLLDVRMLPALLLLVLLPVVAVLKVPVRRLHPLRQAAHNAGGFAVALLVLVAVVLACYQPLASAMRNHKQLRYLMNPLNAVYAVGVVATAPLRRNGSQLEPIGLDAVAPAASGRPPLLMLVVGETARAANFGLNGYARPTTPRLAREAVVSFTDATSCGTSTAASLPCMFSHLGRAGYGARRHDYGNLLDVLQQAGLAVLWLDNQSGCKGVCDRVPHASTVNRTDAGLCSDGECLDGVLLADLDQRIAALPAQRRTRGVVLVMHQIGSHGPAYHRRSPAALKQFLPECTSNNLQECSQQEVVNAYDNSILATDQFLAGAIGWLKGRQQAFDGALLYVSDHGESLGENRLYLHGLPYAIAPDVQKKVPWIGWFSPSYVQRVQLDVGCVRERTGRPVSHDDYFHSVLGLMQVRTRVYDAARDAYAPCRAIAPEAGKLVATPGRAAS
jgi:lipid A ethanolaminephosphotransferase